MNVPVGPPALLIPLYSHGELDVEEELQVNEETNLKQCIATKTIPVNKESNAINKSEEIVTTKQCTKTCSKPMNKFMIQCSKCSEWTHYECTNLPAYQLHLSITTTRRYTCEVCSNIPLEFNQKGEPVILSNITSENTTQEEHVCNKKSIESTLEIVNCIEKSVISAITETHEKCQTDMIHELKQQLEHECSQSQKDKISIKTLETNINELTSQNAFLKVSNDISQQLQKLNIKFVENSIPQKEIIDRIEDMKQDNASLISAVQTSHELTDKIENVLKTSRNFNETVSRLEKNTNKMIESINSNSEKTMLLLDALVQNKQSVPSCNIPVQNRFSILSDNGKDGGKNHIDTSPTGKEETSHQGSGPTQ